MATRDQMIADALKEMKEGQHALNKKFDDYFGSQQKELNEFKVKYAEDKVVAAAEMGAIRNTVKILGVIGGAALVAAVSALMKLLLR